MISDDVKDDKEQKTKALLPPKQKKEGRCYVAKAKEMRADYWVHFLEYTENGHESSSKETSDSVAVVVAAASRSGASPHEFSFEELTAAADDFILSNEIGQGGFADVYYTDLRGEVMLGMMRQLLQPWIERAG